ncbi:hypothetical protein ACEN2J_13415 [Pseudorhodobacter sp. W20_MBD10_FR17]|uniref:hypothetical protein n=1 Tax=Pseudorhodobacter sp. W20_MBD10_FR17 TaxID=3240266 RepID=UPI003F9DCB02
MTEQRVILSMKWGTLYSALYVNVLHRACRDHLKGEFRFVCLTDDASGLEPRIEAFPIPNIGCTPEHYRRGAWPKISVFTSALHGLAGRALFIDLDVVILDDIEPFFTVQGPLFGVGGGPDWRHGRVPVAPTLNTSVFGFNLGEQVDISDAFTAAPDAASAQYGNEQQFVEGTARDWAPWPDPWVISYKRHVRRKSLLAPLLGPHPVPQGARIVAFHGKPNPQDFVTESFGRGYRWIGDYWRKYSDG